MTPPNDMPADTELRELNNLLGRLVSVAKKDAVDNEAIKFRKNNIIEWFKQRDAAIRKVAGKTIEFSHTAVNGDMHLFIDDVHDPKLCPECIRPGILSTPTDQKEKE